jgi:hypothetical protein
MNGAASGKAQKPARKRPPLKIKARSEAGAARPEAARKTAPKVAVRIEAEETVETSYGRVPARERFWRYLELLEKTGDLASARAETGLSLCQIVDYRARNPEFDDRCRRMQLVFAYRMEEALYGQVTGDEPNAKLLMFGLENLHPDFRRTAAPKTGKRSAGRLRTADDGSSDIGKLKELYRTFAGDADGREQPGWRGRRQLN